MEAEPWVCPTVSWMANYFISTSVRLFTYKMEGGCAWLASLSPGW